MKCDKMRISKPHPSWLEKSRCKFFFRCDVAGESHWSYEKWELKRKCPEKCEYKFEHKVLGRTCAKKFRSMFESEV